MPDIPFDPFPTAKLAVPNLTALVARLRDTTIKHGITVVHAKKEGEGEWILATAAARLTRSGIKVAGPEPATPPDLVDHALRIDAKVVLAGELRRDADALALRKAAWFGVSAVGVITCIRLGEAQMLLATFGPWTGYDVQLLSQDL
jgi:hypothetical protein